MQILAVDIGTGTQDILLFDTTKEPENALKLIMPAPTQIVARAIQRATDAGETVLLIGATMGGGPCAWAAEEHLAAGGQIFATPSAACTFNDDLQEVIAMGVQIVSEDEARAMQGVTRIEMKDLDLGAIERAVTAFGAPFNPHAIGVAVFDHGAAPAGYSDRKFRFDYLAGRLRQKPTLTALAFLKNDIPPHLTRMAAVADQIRLDAVAILMDTPSAAVLGAREDPHVRAVHHLVAVNIGNGHTLAFRMAGDQVTGLFEHHTGFLSTSRLDIYLDELIAGTIDNESIYRDKGHGALILSSEEASIELLSVTGPRRNLLRSSHHRPYFAVPYGDMMMAGCWGLVRALACLVPAFHETIDSALARGF